MALKDERALYLSVFTTGHAAHHLYTAIIPPLLPVFKAVFGLSYIEAAIILAAFQAGLLAQLPIGVYSDKTGRRKSIVSLGLCFTAITVALLSVAPNYLVVVATALAAGIAASTYHPPGITLVTECFRRRTGFALGMHAVGGSLGVSMGPIALGLLIVTLGWKGSLLALSIPGLMVGILYWSLIRDVALTGPLADDTRSTTAFSIQDVAKAFALLMMAAMMGFFANETLFSFFTLYVTEVHLVSVGFASLLLGLMRIFGVVGGPLGGLGVDRFGAKFMLSLSILGQSVLVMIFTQLGVGTSMYLVLGMIGFFFGIQIPASNSYLANIVPPSHRARAFAIFLSILMAWASLIPILAGGMVEHLGFRPTFLIAAVIGIGGSIISALFLKTK